MGSVAYAQQVAFTGVELQTPLLSPDFEFRQAMLQDDVITEVANRTVQEAVICKQLDLELGPVWEVVNVTSKEYEFNDSSL